MPRPESVYLCMCACVGVRVHVLSAYNFLHVYHLSWYKGRANEIVRIWAESNLLQQEFRIHKSRPGWGAQKVCQEMLPREPYFGLLFFWQLVWSCYYTARSSRWHSPVHLWRFPGNLGTQRSSNPEIKPCKSAVCWIVFNMFQACLPVSRVWQGHSRM